MMLFIRLDQLPAPAEIASLGITNGGRILMGKRRDNNRWTLPGGHLEPGEDPVEGAIREAYEEAGVKPEELKPRMSYLGTESVTTFTGKRMKIHAFTAEMPMLSTSTKNDPDNEVAHWQWIDISNGFPKEIEENLHSPKNVVLRLLNMIKSMKAERLVIDLRKSEPRLTLDLVDENFVKATLGLDIDLVKANFINRPHKYIKRTGGPGNYRYWYYNPRTGQLEAQEHQQTRGRQEHVQRLINAGKSNEHIMKEVGHQHFRQGTGEGGISIPHMREWHERRKKRRVMLGGRGPTGGSSLHNAGDHADEAVMDVNHPDYEKVVAKNLEREKQFLRDKRGRGANKPRPKKNAGAVAGMKDQNYANSHDVDKELMNRGKEHWDGMKPVQLKAAQNYLKRRQEHYLNAYNGNDRSVRMRAVQQHLQHVEGKLPKKEPQKKEQKDSEKTLPTPDSIKPEQREAEKAKLSPEDLKHHNMMRELVDDHGMRESELRQHLGDAPVDQHKRIFGDFRSVNSPMTGGALKDLFKRSDLDSFIRERFKPVIGAGNVTEDVGFVKADGNEFFVKNTQTSHGAEKMAFADSDFKMPGAERDHVFLNLMKNHFHGMEKFAPESHGYKDDWFVTEKFDGEMLRKRSGGHGVPKNDQLRLALTNMVLMNGDRHSGNVMVSHDGKQLRVIDHNQVFAWKRFEDKEHNSAGGSPWFPSYLEHTYGGVGFDYTLSENDVTVMHQTLDAIDREQITSDLKKIGAPKELIRAAVDRIDKLKKNIKVGAKLNKALSTGHEWRSASNRW